MKENTLSRRFALALGVGALAASWGRAGWSIDAQLGDALRGGGLVLVMRHAKSLREAPAPSVAQPENVTFERQLDAEGRAGATAMGQAIKAMGLKISDVLTSPTYRGRETAQLLAVGQPKSMRELGDGGRGMDTVSNGERVEALRRLVQTRPPAGSSVIVITHLPNIRGALGESFGDLAEGEAHVLRPDGSGNTTPIGRIKIDEWPGLAQP